MDSADQFFNLVRNLPRGNPERNARLIRIALYQKDLEVYLDPEDFDLLNHFLETGESALDSLILENIQVAIRTAQSFDIRNEEFLDLISSSLESIIKYALKFDPVRGSFYSYAKSIARNRLIAIYNTRKKEWHDKRWVSTINAPALGGFGEHQTSVEDGLSVSAEESFIFHANKRDLTEALDLLCEKYPDNYYAVMQSIYNGLTFEEIGNGIGRPKQTIHLRYHRGIQLLKEILTSKEF